MTCSPAPTPPPPARRRTLRRSGFTLLEVMIGLSLFVIAGLGVMETIGLINQNATVNRAMTAARMLVGAKISKAQTDIYTPSNGVVPPSCMAPLAGNAPYANQDTNDPFDFSATQTSPVTVVDNPNDPTAAIKGTVTQTVTTYEAASKTLLVTFSLTFTYRGKPYTVSQSTIRAPDQL